MLESGNLFSSKLLDSASYHIDYIKYYFELPGAEVMWIKRLQHHVGNDHYQFGVELIEMNSHFLQNETEIFAPSSGGAEKVASEMSVRFLGRLPLDPRIGELHPDLIYSSSSFCILPEPRLWHSALGILLIEILELMGLMLPRSSMIITDFSPNLQPIDSDS